MKLELITDFEWLDSNQDHWNDLAANADCRGIAGNQVSGRNQNWKGFPFYRWEWLGTWFKEMVDGQPYVLLATDDDGQWLGLAPFFIESSALQNRLCLWGSGTTCTDYMGLISTESATANFALAVSDWLTKETRAGGKLASIDVVELEGGTEQMNSTQQLDVALDANGFKRYDDELEGCWVVELDSDWRVLESKLSKSMRRKTKKATKRINDEATTIRSTESFPLSELWSEFVRLHQHRRESLGQPGCFADPAFERFLKSATESLVAQGQAELIVIDFEDEALAAMLLFNDGVTNYMYQSGADIDRMKLEPGYQMVYLAILSSLKQNLSRFDFLRGDEPYKARWNTERIPLLRTRWIPRKLTAIFKQNLWLTGRSIKRYLHRTTIAE
ncbi:MAG: GNAT family N-acetyltransferase [Planctomycetota bacterium]